MATTKHVHKYYKMDLYSTKVWSCGLDGCGHYMPDHLKEKVRGRTSLCWSCNEKFILNDINMKTIKPTCDDCNPSQRGLEIFIDGKFAEAGIKSKPEPFTDEWFATAKERNAAILEEVRRKRANESEPEVFSEADEALLNEANKE